MIDGFAKIVGTIQTFSSLVELLLGFLCDRNRLKHFRRNFFQLFSLYILIMFKATIVHFIAGQIRADPNIELRIHF